MCSYVYSKAKATPSGGAKSKLKAEVNLTVYGMLLCTALVMVVIVSSVPLVSQFLFNDFFYFYGIATLNVTFAMAWDVSARYQNCCRILFKINIVCFML